MFPFSMCQSIKIQTASFKTSGTHQPASAVCIRPVMIQKTKQEFSRLNDSVCLFVGFSAFKSMRFLGLDVVVSLF